jgi:nicotinamide riboside transporter PnuC
MDIALILVIVIAAMLGVGMSYGGLVSIFLAFGWLDAKTKQRELSESTLAIIKGAALLCILAIALYLSAQIVQLLSSFEEHCPCYVSRSFIFAVVFGLFLVSRSATYRKFIVGKQ